MKERVLVTAFSLCVLLSICPGSLVYANDMGLHIEDLVMEISRIQEEVSEKGTSVSDASEEDDSENDLSEQLAADYGIVPSAESVLHDLRRCSRICLPGYLVLLPEYSNVSSSRAPPEA